MEKYFDLPGIGEMAIDHQFYELNDEPILFVCIDDSGTRYLCSCCLPYEKWVVAQVDETELIDLMNDKIPIRKIFETHIDTVIFVSWDGCVFSIDTAISTDLFPRSGATLELPYERNGSYYQLLRQELLLKALTVSNQSTAPVWQFNITFSCADIIIETPALSQKKIRTYCDKISSPDVMSRVGDTDINDFVEASEKSPAISIPSNPKSKKRKKEESIVIYNSCNSDYAA